MSGEDKPECPFCRTLCKGNTQGITLSVRLQVRSAQKGPLGFYGGSGEQLKWGINAAPVDGEANAELVFQLSRFFGLPQSEIEIISGQKSRSKVVYCRGVTIEKVTAALNAILQKSRSKRLT